MALSTSSSESTRSGLLRRLAQDRSGNVLAMAAAAVIPMIAIVGSGIDISRLYLTKSRLQAACDSAVLAGRKAMTTATYTTAAQDRANAMFNFNFQNADYSSTSTSFTSSADSTGRLSGTARTTVPMLVMNMMGFQPHQITAVCSADIQVPNIDVVFVLDVTGSMDEYVGSTKKIDALKTATKNFYDTIKTALGTNTRSQVRYGFVPYSQAVNGRDLFVATPNSGGNDLGQLPLSHLITNMTVQSRVANFTTADSSNWAPDPASTPTSFDQTFISSNSASFQPDSAVTGTGTVISNNDCEQYSDNLSFSVDNSTNYQAWFPMRTSWPGGAGIGDSVLYKAEGMSNWQASEPTSGNSYIRATFSRVSGTWNDNSGAQTGNYQTCTRRVTHTRYIRQSSYRFTNWTYKPVVYDVANFAAGNPISYVSSIDTSAARVSASGSYDLVQLAGLSNQTGFTRTNTSWTGCLEERDTTPATTFTPIPVAAKDLDYLTGGTADNLRWRPIMRELTFRRNGTAAVTTTTTGDTDNNNGTTYDKPDYTCPSARMRNLRTYATEAEFDSYVNSLSPGGYTYLDVGMIWGLRLISPRGMFASRNLTGPNGGQISRHIIFLTDGEPVSQLNTYSAYGVEETERRISGSTGVSPATLHARRFQALCDVERGSVAIWAIALGTSVTGNMSSCADPGRAMQADNTAQLNAAFQRIANEIADLRLVQ